MATKKKSSTTRKSKAKPARKLPSRKSAQSRELLSELGKVGRKIRRRVKRAL